MTDAGFKYRWLDIAVGRDKRVARSAAALRIAIYLWGRANKNLEAWPSQRRIAEDLGIDRSTVQRGLDLLVKCGLIRSQKRRSSRSDREHNNYRLSLTEDHKFEIEFRATILAMRRRERVRREEHGVDGVMVSAGRGRADA